MPDEKPQALEMQEKSGAPTVTVSDNDGQRPSQESESSSSASSHTPLHDAAQDDRELPQPATTPKPPAKLSATMIVPIWIVLSSGVIIYNNYVYNTLNFRYPVFLVTWHLTFAVSPPFVVCFISLVSR